MSHHDPKKKTFQKRCFSVAINPDNQGLIIMTRICFFPYLLNLMSFLFVLGHHFQRIPSLGTNRYRVGILLLRHYPHTVRGHAVPQIGDTVAHSREFYQDFWIHTVVDINKLA
jgi:hypothetical protein